MCPRKQTNSLRSLQKDRDSAGFVTMWDQGWVVARPMLVQITLDKGSECFIFPKIVGGGSCGRPRSTGPSGSRMTILASVGYVTELLRIQKMQNPLYKCLFWLWQVHRIHQHYLCPVHQLRPVYQICPAPPAPFSLPDPSSPPALSSPSAPSSPPALSSPPAPSSLWAPSSPPELRTKGLYQMFLWRHWPFIDSKVSQPWGNWLRCSLSWFCKFTELRTSKWTKRHIKTNEKTRRSESDLKRSNWSVAMKNNMTYM